MTNIAQAALALQVSRRTILRIIESGDLPAVKLPGRTGAYIIESSDIDALGHRRAIRESGDDK